MTHAGMENYAPKNSSNLEQTFWCLIVPRTRVKIGAFMVYWPFCLPLMTSKVLL